MAKHCPSCGAELTEGAKFCLKCGANVEMSPSTSTQPQTYQPMTHPRNINQKMIAIFFIIIIIVIAVLLIVFLSGNNSFVGKWEVQYTGGGPEMIWVVNSDGTVIAEYNGNSISGTWEMNGDVVCGYWETNPDDYRCFTIEFSNGGNTLKAYYQGELEYIATRI